MSLFIVKPPSGSKRGKGVVFQVECVQQIPPGIGGSVVTLQQSLNEDGPWLTCEGFGQGGSIEVNSQPWDVRDTGFSIQEVRQFAETYVRAAVFDDQGLTGPPVVASLPVYYPKPLEMQTGGVV